MHDKILITTYLSQLLDKYKLTKFLCFKSTIYPRLIKIFYANLGLVDDKVSYYVMHKLIIIDFVMLVKEFEIDASSPKLIARSFPNYRKELAIDMLFPY